MKRLTPLLLAALPLWGGDADLPPYTASSNLALSVPFPSYQKVENLGEIEVELQDPNFSKGRLSTTSGGIIKSSELWMQAQEIAYFKEEVDGEDHTFLQAKGQVLVIYGERVFVGDAFTYDFTAHEGELFGATTGVGFWFISGEKITFKPNGSYTIEEALFTTSDNKDAQWQISSSRVEIYNDHRMIAKDVALKLRKAQLLYLPKLKANIKFFSELPLEYRFQWGSSNQRKVGVRYHAFSYDGLDIWGRIDYRFARGLGLGIDGDYLSPDKRDQISMRNYVARDSTVENSKKKTRYRFNGGYKHQFENKKLNFLASYDRLSDSMVPGDYSDKDLDLPGASKTQAKFFYKDNKTIASVGTLIKLNGFQSVKQEFPLVKAARRPFYIGETGILSDHRLQIGYLDFEFANGSNQSDFHSVRFISENNWYYPIKFHQLHITPSLGFNIFAYNNSQNGTNAHQILPSFHTRVSSHLKKEGKNLDQLLEPYIHYSVMRSPQNSLEHHYIFDLKDGLSKLNLIKLGAKDMLYKHGKRWLSAEVYTFAFFEKPSDMAFIPKTYTEVTYWPYPYLTLRFNNHFDHGHGQMDLSSARAEYTHSEKLACATEIRHRGKYRWTKSDPENFFLEMERSQAALAGSTLSDRNNIVLLEALYRFDPNWTGHLQSRHGWNRIDEPTFNEYALSLSTAIGSNWKVNLSYVHQKVEDRVLVHITLSDQPPGNFKKKL